MYWDDDYPTKSKPYEHPDRKRTLELLEKIKEVSSRTAHVNSDQDPELSALYKELQKLQEECLHTWEVIPMFHFHRRYCKICDKEDKLYRHQD